MSDTCTNSVIHNLATMFPSWYVDVTIAYKNDKVTCIALKKKFMNRIIQRICWRQCYPSREFEFNTGCLCKTLTNQCCRGNHLKVIVGCFCREKNRSFIYDCVWVTFIREVRSTKLNICFFCELRKREIGTTY